MDIIHVRTSGNYGMTDWIHWELTPKGRLQLLAISGLRRRQGAARQQPMTLFVLADGSLGSKP